MWRAVTAQKSGTQSLSPSFSIFTPLSLSFFFSCCRFQTYWKSTGGKKNHPCRGRKSKKPKVTLSSCWGDKTELGNFFSCCQQEGFACPFAQNEALPCGWWSCSPCSSARNTRGFSPPLLKGRSLSCLPTMGMFAVGTRMKPRCWWPELWSELPECWVQTQLWPGILKEKCC